MNNTYESYEPAGKGKNNGGPFRTKIMLVREGRQKKRVAIQGPADVFRFLAGEARRLDREHFWRIDLDARNQIIGYEVCSIGTLTASLVHPREVFKGACLANSAGIIIAHNHPSGEVQPSPEDKSTTRRLVAGGKLLGIPVLDHVILTTGSYFSFRDKGLMSG